ncbi:glycosyltransferase [Bacillus sp. B190/17]|uniref:Glycosyltransferase n=1 Tax=Bacillus lumedeiriae TaxID=3058829 RepID=A0ABW8I9T0_9BACI
MDVLLIHKNKAYLPEISAYKEYFNKHSTFVFHDINDVKKEDIGDFDALWTFMGIEALRRPNKDQLIIHEYNSLSVGDFSYIKDFFKKHLNMKPDLRIFLNQQVKEKYNFKEGIPYLYRDMGIHDSFFITYEAKKEYDFTYVGSVSKERNTHHLLNHFKNKLKKQTILLVGHPPDEIYQEFKRCPNIVFTGSVSYTDVASLASKAIYGINYMPDRHPFNLQTSTKLIEYFAMGLKVITTDYKWVQYFEEKNNIKIFKIDEDLTNFNMDSVSNFNHQRMDVTKYKWEKVLEEAKVIQCLNKLLT